MKKLILVSLALFVASGIAKAGAENTASAVAAQELFDGSQTGGTAPDSRGLVVQKVYWTKEYKQKYFSHSGMPRKLSYTLQKAQYRIANRKRYVAYERREGGWNGAIMGSIAGSALGAAAIVATGAIVGIGLGWGLALILAGALAGWLIGRANAAKNARNKPEIFEEVTADNIKH